MGFFRQGKGEYSDKDHDLGSDSSKVELRLHSCTPNSSAGIFSTASLYYFTAGIPCLYISAAYLCVSPCCASVDMETSLPLPPQQLSLPRWMLENLCNSCVTLCLSGPLEDSRV